MTDNDLLLVAVADGWATVTLNRPALHNRLDALGEIDANADLRVIVPTATANSVCSGYDLGRLAKVAAGEAPVGERVSFATLVDRLEAMGAPTIARRNGGVFGGGTDLGLRLSQLRGPSAHPGRADRAACFSWTRRWMRRRSSGEARDQPCRGGRHGPDRSGRHLRCGPLLARCRRGGRAACAGAALTLTFGVSYAYR